MEKRKHYVNSLNFQIEFLGRTFNHLSKKFFKESNTNINKKEHNKRNQK